MIACEHDNIAHDADLLNVLARLAAAWQPLAPPVESAD